MACKGFIQLLLKVINFLFTLVGLAMIGYGIYMVVIYNNSSSSPSPPPPPPPSPPPPSPPPPSPPPPSLSPPPPSPPPPSASPPPPPPSPPPPSPPPPSEVNFVIYQTPPMLTSEGNIEDGQMDIGNSVLQLRRTLLSKSYKDEFSSLSSFWSRIPTAWFLYLFIVVGVVITLITCSGCIAAATANGCCLSCYSIFVGLFMILELALAAFIFFDSNWQDVIPEDSTGELDSIEDFIEDRIDILKWVALAAMILQALALLLAVILRAINSRPGKDYDSDDEYLAPRQSRQPLLNRQATSGTSASTVGSENRSARTDAWSTRMREKYGLDTTEFSYNPESKRFSQPPPSVEENKGCCTIM